MLYNCNCCFGVTMLSRILRELYIERGRHLARMFVSEPSLKVELYLQ